jgi:hypothetical protein
LQPGLGQVRVSDVRVGHLFVNKVRVTHYTRLELISLHCMNRLGECARSVCECTTKRLQRRPHSRSRPHPSSARRTPEGRVALMVRECAKPWCGQPDTQPCNFPSTSGGIAPPLHHVAHSHIECHSPHCWPLCWPLPHEDDDHVASFVMSLHLVVYEIKYIRDMHERP